MTPPGGCALPSPANRQRDLRRLKSQFRTRESGDKSAWRRPDGLQPLSHQRQKRSVAAAKSTTLSRKMQMFSRRGARIAGDPATPKKLQKMAPKQLKSLGAVTTFCARHLAETVRRPG